VAEVPGAGPIPIRIWAVGALRVTPPRVVRRRDLVGGEMEAVGVAAVADDAGVAAAELHPLGHLGVDSRGRDSHQTSPSSSRRSRSASSSASAGSRSAVQCSGEELPGSGAGFESSSAMSSSLPYASTTVSEESAQYCTFAFRRAAEVKSLDPIEA